MGYSGYRDKDSSNILNKYQLIKESNNTSNKQTLNEIAPAIPIGIGLWELLAAAGITGGLLVTLQQAFPPETVKQIENFISSVTKEGQALASATSAGAAAASINALATLASSSSKPLGSALTGFAKLISDAEQGSVTEEQALSIYKNLTDQLYKAVYSSINGVEYSSNPTVASIQKRLANAITVNVSKEQEEDLKKAQAWEDLLKRNKTQTGPGQSQEPKKPDDKDPLWKRIWKKVWRSHWIVRVIIVLFVLSKIPAIFGAVGAVGSAISNIPVIGPAANYVKDIGWNVAKWGFNKAIGRQEGDVLDMPFWRTAEATLGETPPSPEQHSKNVETSRQEAERRFNQLGLSTNKSKVNIQPAPARRD